MEDIVMHELQRMAERIARILEELKNDEGILPNRLPELAKDAIGRGNEINCYPGIPGHKCYDFALFISLQSPTYNKNGRRSGIHHMNCGTAMEKIVQHMQGYCRGKTNTVLFITDNWDVPAFEEWRSNLLQVRNDALFEIYLLVAGRVSPIPL
jgi:hypothetical protein